MPVKQGSPGTSSNRSTENTQSNDVALDELDRAAKEGAFEPGHGKVKKSIGFNPSPSRVEDYVYVEFAHRRRAEEKAQGADRGGLSQRDIDRLWDEAEQEVLAAPKASEAVRAIEDWAPTSECEVARGVESESLVHAAVLMLPHLFWLMLRLMVRTGGRGPKPARRLTAATFMYMAFRRGRPEVMDAMKATRGSQALLNWAWRFPRDERGGPSEKTEIYGALHKMLDAAALPPSLIEHIQVETFKQLAMQVEGHDRAGNPIYQHPRAGVALVADGSFAEGQAQQTPYLDEDHRQIRVRYRDDREGIRLRAYYDSNGNFSKLVIGYKNIALVCLTTGRCVI